MTRRRTRNLARGLSIFIAVVTLASAVHAQDMEPRSTITRESIRRAVVPIDSRQAAGDRQSDMEWRSVARMKTGAEMRVVLDDRQEHRGRFRSADDRSVTLEIDGVNRTMPRAQVRKVDTRSGARVSSAKGWGLLGMFSGLAAGAASCRGKEGECIQGAPLSGMMLGWITGAIVGASLPSWRSIYAARP